jgi:hypothetical protein
MPSRTYELFAEAMRERRPIMCMYGGHPRAICPVILGHSNGHEKALTWQFDGSSSDGAVRGDWKCLFIARVNAAEIIDGPWQSGDSHMTAQACVKDVDLDVNPVSPYSPKRQLGKSSRTG